MDQLLRMAKSLRIPRWRALRIKVTNAKKNAEAELDEIALESLSSGHYRQHETAMAELRARLETLEAVLAWMQQIEEALDG